MSFRLLFHRCYIHIPSQDVLAQVLRLLGAIETTSEDSILNWLEKVNEWSPPSKIYLRHFHFFMVVTTYFYWRNRWKLYGNYEIVKFLHSETVLKTVGNKLGITSKCLVNLDKFAFFYGIIMHHDIYQKTMIRNDTINLDIAGILLSMEYQWICFTLFSKK